MIDILSHSSMNQIKHMKIYCANAYTWHNKGDAALVITHLESLRKVLPTAELVLMSDNPVLDSEKYNTKAVSPPYIPWSGFNFQPFRTWLGRHLGWRLPRVFNPTGKSRPWIWISRNLLACSQTIQMFYRLLKLWLYIRVLDKDPLLCFGQHERNSASELINSDAIISVPGGYLMAFKPYETNWYRRIFPIFVAQIARIPVILAPMSIGPFIGYRNWLIARISMQYVDSIYVREQKSAEILAEMGVSEQRVRIVADAAFALRPGRDEEGYSKHLLQIESDKRMRIGVSVRYFDFPQAKDSELRKLRYVQDMATLLDHAIEKYGASIWLMPQVILPTGDDDLPISRKVIELMRHQANVSVIEEDLTPQQLQAIYGAMDIFVGVRMHANIFSMLSGTPTLAIAYQKKTQGIMDSLGLSEWVLDIYELTAQRIIERLDALVARRHEITKQLPVRIEALRKSVEISYLEICSAIASSGEQVDT